jgi:hypothetical protein
VLETRELARTRAEGELAWAASEHERARQAVARAQHALDQQLERVDQASAVDAAGGQAGSGPMLMRRAAYRRRQHEIARGSRDKLRQAQTTLLEAGRTLTRAQRALAEALGAHQALELDRSRYEHAQRSREQRREQDEHDERAAAQHGRARRV